MYADNWIEVHTLSSRFERWIDSTSNRKMCEPYVWMDGNEKRKKTELEFDVFI